MESTRAMLARAPTQKVLDLARALHYKADPMENDWATEHLQTIRTLMERSALYRRALAPVMIVTGSIGLLAAVVPCVARIEGNALFSLFWMGISLVALAAAFLLVRRQALKEAEPFWSSPTRRVTQALLPAFVVGLAAGALFALSPPSLPDATWLLAVVWIIAYGCALHPAGFFMQRGIRLLAWVFIVCGCFALYILVRCPAFQTSEVGHYLMGTFFGLLHLAYGIYLCFTEKRKNDA
jgi:hypothetical protein